MQTTNYALTERLENVYRSMSLSPHHQTTSLLNEMEMSDSEKSLNASRRPFSQIDEDEDVEVENPEIRINSEELTDEVSKKSWLSNMGNSTILRETNFKGDLKTAKIDKIVKMVVRLISRSRKIMEIPHCIKYEQSNVLELFKIRNL